MIYVVFLISEMRVEVPEWGKKGKWVQFPHGPATVIGKPGFFGFAVRKFPPLVLTIRRGRRDARRRPVSQETCLFASFSQLFARKRPEMQSIIRHPHPSRSILRIHSSPDPSEQEMSLLLLRVFCCLLRSGLDAKAGVGRIQKTGTRVP